MIYGDTDPFDDSIEHRTIDKITEEEIMRDVGKFIKVVIIIDWYGTSDLSKDDLLLLKELVETYKINMYYYGERYMKFFEEAKFTEEELEEDIRGIGYIGSKYIDTEVNRDEWDGNPYVVHIDWREWNEEEAKRNSKFFTDSVIAGICIDAGNYVRQVNENKRNIWRNK